MTVIASTTDDGTFSNPAVLQPTWTAPAKTNADRPIRLTLTVSDGLTSHTVSVVITVRGERRAGGDHQHAGP